jgi:molybdopterin/thiamine biosynthesis adenylyltransferase
LPGLSNLNSLNKIEVVDEAPFTSATEDPAALADAVKAYTLVCLADQSEATQLRVSQACRSCGVAFMAAACTGFHGSLFIDLGDKHDYTWEDKESKAKVEGVKSFVPLADALAQPYPGGKPKREIFDESAKVIN